MVYALCLETEFLCTTARSQRESDSPVVSETAGSQRGMRGRGKTTSAQSCKLVE